MPIQPIGARSVRALEQLNSGRFDHFPKFNEDQYNSTVGGSNSNNTIINRKKRIKSSVVVAEDAVGLNEPNLVLNEPNLVFLLEEQMNNQEY